MTFARALGGGLADLTAFNIRLIAQEVGSDEVVEEVESASGILNAGAAEAGYVDPDDDEGDGAPREEVRGRFATADPLGFNRVKEWIEQTIFQGQTQGRSPLIAAFVNEWAEEMAPGDDPFPASLADQILANEKFMEGATWLPVREQLDSLPPGFQTTLEGPDGVEINYTVVNNPLTGPQFIEQKTVEQIVDKYVPDLRAPSRMPTGVGTAPAITGSTEQGGQQSGQPRFNIVPGQPPVPVDEEPEGLDRTERLIRQGPSARASMIRDAVNNARSMIPFVSGDDLIAAMQPKPQTRGGGGGGGGTTRTIEFDKDHLLSQVEDKWNRWMISDKGAPMGTIGSWVDSYIREARAFWVSKGGQLDFDTYVTQRLREHPRYATIYRDKEPSESEEQFLAKFQQPINQLGLRGDVARMQTEQAVTSGGDPASQLKRVSRTREAQLVNQGNLSQRFAVTLRGIGVG